MAEKQTANVAAQQTMMAGFGFFKQAAEQQFESYARGMEEVAKLQAKWVEQSVKSFDEASELVKTGLKYWTDLGADARKVSLDVAKKTVDMVP